MSLAIGSMSHPAMQVTELCSRLAFEIVLWDPRHGIYHDAPPETVADMDCRGNSCMIGKPKF